MSSRSPEALVHPKKLKNKNNENDLNEGTDLGKPRAIRNLILIRHGQYELNGKTDAERILTKIGERRKCFNFECKI